MNVGTLIYNIWDAIVSGAQSFYNLLMTDILDDAPSWLMTLLGGIGINHLSLISVLAGGGLIVLVLYSILVK